MPVNAALPRGQRGQAIVLIAIMLAVLVGMAALAIDGSRAYESKRSLQAAVDSASLAGADTLQQTRNFVTAEQAATASFSSNRRLYTAPACAPGYGTPGAGPLTITCTYSDGTVLTQVVASLGPAGYSFTLTATRSLQLQFARILTNGSSPTISARASSGVDNLLYSPTVAALSQAGCGGVPGASITVNGGGNLQVIGDIVSNGVISVAGGNVQAGGDVYARCQATVPGVSMKCYPSGANPGCTYPDVAGITRSGYRFVDPNYPPPIVVGGSQSAVGTNVVMSPGSYAADPNFVGGDCWFLKGGVYYWQGGYTNNGDFVSNELKPPDEPMINNNQNVSPKQFWNGDGAQCAGAYQLSAFNGPNGLPHNNWAIVVTSVRFDTYNGVSYRRESAPSVCRTVRTNPGNDVIKIDISNVPGASSYNVYITRAGGDCGGPWGLVENIPVVGTVSNANTNPCPLFTGNGCSLGRESAVLDNADVIPLFAPNAGAAWGTFSSYPPSPETSPLGGNRPNENANRAAPPAGDKANENQCLTVGAIPASCPAAITPGAVVYYIPNGGCLTDTSAGDTYVFSGYQYNWMLVYEPGAAYPPANACNNAMGAATDTAFIGLVYMPAASVTIQKASAFRTDETGGVIANTITFSGQLPMIIGNDAYSPVQPGGKLTS
ncbi:MAG: TadE/TadG family type IV pilus assembly protein [Candidatus Dormiibacterota bacterium]